MTPTWRQIRALNYGTIGRTVHAVVRHSGSEVTEEVWFDPPRRRRCEFDGEPTLISTPNDEWRRSPDGMVHTDLGDGTVRLMSVMGAHSGMLLDAHQNWPLPGSPFASNGLSDPTDIAETEVHGRRGWRVSFVAHEHRPAQSYVIDAETGFAIAWSGDDSGIEVLSHSLDDDLSPDLFRWTGDSIEDSDEMARHQAAHDEKQRLLADIPRSEPTWYPTTINVTASDGDPSTGALDMSVSLQGPYVTLRRWLTGTPDPEPSPFASHYSDPVRRVDPVWTHELTSTHGAITVDDAHRVLESIPPVEPPRPAHEIVDEIASVRAGLDRELVTPGKVESTGVIYSGGVHVGYGQYYLPSEAEWDGDFMGAFTGQRNGLVGTHHPANVVLVCGLHTGTISVTVEMAETRPEPDATAWEEIVEAPLAVDTPLRLTGWDDGAPGTVFPISRGTYRIRYCANNMDAAREADVGEFIDSYLITIWPSEITPDEVIKQTSEIADYWNNQAHT